MSNHLPRVTSNDDAATAAPVAAPVAAPATDTETRSFVELRAALSIRLPDFWRSSARQWFQNAEVIFRHCHIRANIFRVGLVLSALDDDSVHVVVDLVRLNASYEAIKSRLIITYGESQPQSAGMPSSPVNTGGRSPSRLLGEMRYFFPDSLADSVLKMFWCVKLPAEVRAAILGINAPLDELAQIADRTWAERPERFSRAAAPGRPPAVSSTNHTNDARHQLSLDETNARVEGLENVVALLTEQISRLCTHVASQATSSSSQSTAGQTPRPLAPLPALAGWCYYHRRFAERARRCSEPCTFTPATRNGDGTGFHRAPRRPGL